MRGGRIRRSASRCEEYRVSRRPFGRGSSDWNRCRLRRELRCERNRPALPAPSACRVSSTVTDTERLQRELIERNVDFLISPRFDLFAHEQFDFEILRDASYVVVAGAQNPWARRRRVELNDLVNEPWVLPSPETPVGSLAMNVFRASGIDYPRATVFVLSPVVRISLLKSGRFLTIVSTSVLGFPNKRPEFKVLPVELLIAHPPIGIVTLKQRTLSTVAQRFIDSAREVAKPLAKGKL
jgi:DNA-binding transcriptional LysR family regulator